MKRSLLSPAAFAVALALMPAVSDLQQGWAGDSERGQDVLAVLFGDSRRLFATHFYLKADAYFHRGYYPTIFDNRDAYATPHMAEGPDAEAGREAGEDHVFMVASRDWIETFGRRFIPTAHTHLEAGEGQTCSACADEGHGHGEGQEGEHEGEDEGGDEGGAGLGEMMPWLQLSMVVDPQRVESYVVAAYWLEEAGRSAEAERVLRDGLRANPGSSELLFELGRQVLHTHGDAATARRLWTLALRRGEERRAGAGAPDAHLQGRILSYLATAEEQLGDLDAARAHLRMAESVTGNRGLYAERLRRMMGE